MRMSNNVMEGIIEDMRWMFMTRPSDKMLTSTSDLIEGVLFPIPTLRTLALQNLVLNNWPIEEFVPGEGYSHQANYLRLLTKECVGEYQMTGLEESFVYGDGIEGTDEDKEIVRADDLNTGVVQVTKLSSGGWKIGDLLSFSPRGCLRHEIRFDGDTDVMKKFALQEWIQGSSLVWHRFSECYYTDKEDSNTDGDDVINDKIFINGEDKLVVDIRVAVTFYQGMLIYKERVVNNRRCTTCNNNSCSFKYSVTAWFLKKY